jgi:hypothetical protein
MKQALNNSLNLLKSNIKTYIALNILFYLLMICFMIYAYYHPELKSQIRGEVEGAIKNDSLFGEYFTKAKSGNFNIQDALFFIPLIWIKNILSAFISIVLPSIIIPFLGVITGLFQSFAFGVGFSPTDGINLKLFTGILLIILEGQGAILAMLASYVLGKNLTKVRPLKDAYRSGLRDCLNIFLLVIVILFCAAIYESVCLIFKI